MNLLNLPQDTINEIMKLLDWKSFQSTRAVSKLFYKIDTDELKKRLIEQLKGNQVTQVTAYHNPYISNYHYISHFVKKNGATLKMGHDVGNDLPTIIADNELKNIEELFVSYYQVALKKDGSIWKSLKQDHNLSEASRQAVMMREIKNIPQIKSFSTGRVYIHLLAVDGTVWCCDLDSLYASKPTKMPIENVRKVINTFFGLFFIKNDNSLWSGISGWGGNYANMSISAYSKLGQLRDIYYHNLHFICIKLDGTLWVRGENSKGELGLGHQNSVNDFTKVLDIENVKEIIMCNGLTVCLKEDGTLWFSGDSALLGKNEGIQTKFILIAKLDEVIRLQKGGFNQGIEGEKFFLLITKKNGKAYIYGENTNGQLGLGHKEPLSGFVEHPTLNKWVDLTEAIKNASAEQISAKLNEARTQYEHISKIN